jgi:hypothetical protein
MPGIQSIRYPRVIISLEHNSRKREHRLGVLVRPQVGVGPQLVGGLEQTAREVLDIDGQDKPLVQRLALAETKP